MRSLVGMAGLLGLLALVGLSGTSAGLEVPLEDLKVVPLAGISFTPQGAAVAFDKSGEERRLLAWEGKPEAGAAGMVALQLSHNVQMTSGQAPRAAVLIFDADGGTWCRVGSGPVKVGGPAQTRLSLTGLRPTAFSQDTSGALEWEGIRRIWVGLVFDGPAQGVAELSAARFTDEPYVATEPVRLLGEGAGKWTVGQDPAVKSTLTTPNEGPDGTPCMKYEFTVPVGPHMYALPQGHVVGSDFEGFTALRFRYRCKIPTGMRLLITLAERGGAQWYTEPPGPWAEDWTVMVLPFTDFKPAGWGARDPNGKLDITDVGSVIIGTHGGAQGDGSGLIMATDVEFVP